MPVSKETNLTPSVSKLTAVDLENLHNQVISFFNEKWEEGEENERFKKGKHWSESQEATIKGQNRQPYSMAAISTKLGTISSTQLQARTAFRVEAAVDPADEIKAELATLMLKDAERRSKFKYVESEVFNSGMGIKYGAGEVYVDYSELEPKIMFRKLDYKDVVWDKNNKHYDIDEDGLWIAKIDKVYRYQLKNEYGEIIDELAEDEGEFGREKESYYISKNPDGKSDFDLISKFTHYQKVIRKVWYVLHPDSKKLLGLQNQFADKFDNKEEAERRLRELNIPYLANGFDIEGSIEDKDEVGYDRYVFADSKILEYERTNLPSFPIKIYKCFTFEDDFWSFMDMLKSPQIFMDRLFSQIDYTFGTDIKNIYQLNVQALAEGETAESAERKAAINGGVIKTNSNELAIQSVPSKGINPQWVQVANIMQSFIEDFAGGRSFQGLSEGAGESGKAINLKKQQGALVASLMLDNLSRWKQSIGELALWMIGEYDTAERQIKIQGQELTPEMLQLLQENGIYTPSQISKEKGFLTINKGGIPILKDAEFELIVTESSLTATEKEFKYAQILEAGKFIPTLQSLPTYTELLLKYNPDISTKDRNQLITEFKNYLQAQAKQAQEENERENTKIKQDGAEKLGKLQLEALKLKTTQEN